MVNDLVVEPRSSLYYGQYQYAITWYQMEIGCIRTLDALTMQKAMNWRLHFENRRLNLGFGARQFTEHCRNNLESIRSLLAAEIEPFKLICYTDWATVYTNDATLKNRLDGCDWIPRTAIKQAMATLPPDTVFLQDPQHQYRTYFRSQKLTDTQLKNFADWMTSQGSDIKASKSLSAFLWARDRRSRYQYPSVYAQTHYFVDHNSLQYPTMIAMIVPGLVRKTVKLAKKP